VAETLEVFFEGDPHFEQCPTPGCTNTEDLMVQELARGYTWAFTSSVCGHWAFVYRKEVEGRGTLPSDA
jgi:hypothetical protein